MVSFSFNNTLVSDDEGQADTVIVRTEQIFGNKESLVSAEVEEVQVQDLEEDEPISIIIT